MEGSLPVSSVHEISQARILEWVAISFSRGIKSRNQTCISCLAGSFSTSEPLGLSNIIHKTQWFSIFDLPTVLRIIFLPAPSTPSCFQDYVLFLVFRSLIMMYSGMYFFRFVLFFLISSLNL